MRRFAIVLPLAPMAVGERYSVRDWPLHVTVAPVFRTTAGTSVLAHVLGDAARDHPALACTAGAEALFGARHDTPVTLIEPHQGLRELHAWLSKRLAAEFAGRFGYENPHFAGAGFSPHVTATNRGRAVPGQGLALGQLALVDMAPGPGPGRPEVVAVAGLALA
ncbi:2'-5' RNA ligase family protein [Sinomonas halotolerans]|uniref:2'-5' RNA ligase family protein n=1 Tax=Sinomonas halotolerans TaxID=1644133 RepID=A0ABU9WZ50_9MICC